MISIAIINLKGGVGKSVTACNLAAELAAKSKSVLVVDLDKQGNTSKFFGVLDYDSPSVAEVMLGEDDILAAIVKGVDVWGVHLLPCDMRMLKANRTILMDNGPRQFHLRDALKCVAGDYDYCIMDCPPDLDMGCECGICHGRFGPIHYDEPSDAAHPLSFVVDEIKPVAKWKQFGYPSARAAAEDWDNLQAAHYFCNAQKRDKTASFSLDFGAKMTKIPKVTDGSW